MSKTCVSKGLSIRWFWNGNSTPQFAHKKTIQQNLKIGHFYLYGINRVLLLFLLNIFCLLNFILFYKLNKLTVKKSEREKVNEESITKAIFNIYNIIRSLIKIKAIIIFKLLITAHYLQKYNNNFIFTLFIIIYNIYLLLFFLMLNKKNY